MPIRYRCPECGQLLSIATRMIGQTVPCPRCQLPTTVPAEDDSSFRPPLAAAMNEPAPPPILQTIDAPPPAPPLVSSSMARSELEVPELAVHETDKSHHAAAGEPQLDRDSDELLNSSSAGDTGGFRIRRRSDELDEMDLTPMVDMTFLLLIFFMITASFSLQKTLEVPPPTPDQQGASQSLQTLDDLESRSIIVRITDENVILIDDEPLADKSRLAQTLQALRTTERNEVVLSAADAAFHETVVAVIDAANEAGMQKIRLATRPAESW